MSKEAETFPCAIEFFAEFGDDALKEAVKRVKIARKVKDLESERAWTSIAQAVTQLYNTRNEKNYRF